METEQRHLQMLLTVSSFGESHRRVLTGGGIFKCKYAAIAAFVNLNVIELIPAQGEARINVGPFPNS